jgi:multiple sugar transport system permease protein
MERAERTETAAAARPEGVAAPRTACARQNPALRRRRTVRALLYVVAVVMSLWVLAPIYLITVTAFTPRQAIFDFPKPLVPTEVSGETVSFFARSSGVLTALGTSLMVAAITLAMATVLGAPAGYAIARFAFRGRGAYRLAILSTRAFPIVILAIPLAVTFITWGIFDTLLGVALMHTALALPFTVLVTSSIFVTVPKELEEAARTLGCTPVGAFVRVVLPLALPGLAAAGIFTWELSWNEVFAATILTLDNPTLPALVITTLQGASLPFRFAAAWFMLAPALAGIFLIRRYLLGMWGRVAH